MADNVLDEYLVKLGYAYDRASANQMQEGIARMHRRIIELGVAVEATASAFVYGMAKIARSMESLYYASRRTRSSVENIQAFSFAVSQMGGSAEAARSSLEGLAHFMRSSPGAIGFIRGLGVSTTGKNGQPLGATSIMQGLARRFREMPYYRAQAYANMMGIDENTLIAMINSRGKFSDMYKRMYQGVGLNQASFSRARNFMNELRQIETAVTLIAQKITAVLAGPVGSQLVRLRQSLIHNSAAIIRGIVIIVQTLTSAGIEIVSLFTTLMRLVGHLARLFDNLSEANRRFVLGLGALLVAWRLLSTGFLTSPLGAFLTVLTSILLILQDFETYKRGGKSLIDWNKWLPEIDKIWAATKGFFKAIGGFKTTFDLFLAYFSVTWVSAILGGFARVTAAALKFIGVIGSGSAAAAGAEAAAGAGAGAAAGAGAGAAEGAAGGGLGLAALRVGLRGAGLATGVFGAWAASTKSTSGGAFSKSAAYGKNPKYEEAKQKAAIRYFMAQGWSYQQAIGIVANLTAESGLDPTQSGDKGLAYGIGQWHPARQALFQKVFGHSIKSSSFDEQLMFVQWELTHNYAGAGEALRKAHSYYQAGSIVSRDYEKPLNRNYDSVVRGNMAAGLGGKYKSLSIQHSSTIHVHGTDNPDSVARRVNNTQSEAIGLVARDLLGNSM